MKQPKDLLGLDLTAPGSLSSRAARNTFAEPALASLEIEQRRTRGERFIGERIELADGRIIERDFLPVVGPDGVHQGNLWMHRDVTERLRNLAKIEEASIRDELTGLFNRRGFMQRGHQALAEGIRSGSALLLFFIDLNGMKSINDQLGHEEGHRALVDTARLLEDVFGTGNVIARLGSPASTIDATGSFASRSASAARSSIPSAAHDRPAPHCRRRGDVCGETRTSGARRGHHSADRRDVTALP